MSGVRGDTLEDRLPYNPWAREEYARQTHALALENFDYCFPPWRWLEWRRRHREIQRRIDVLRAARGDS